MADHPEGAASPARAQRMTPPEPAAVSAEQVAAAKRLLTKIRVFVAEQLDEEEAALFASLLAPGVSLAYAGGGDEVTGFGTDFRFDALPEALAETLREGGVRVEGI